MDFLPAPTDPASPAAEVHVWRVVAAAGPSNLVLRRVLTLYLDEEPEKIALDRDEHGKPRLAEEPGRLAFNLSHSGELTLVAVSQGREVGVDVERENPGRDLIALAERALETAEADAVRAATGDDRAHVFYDLWTRHEARLKCLGVGLAGAPPLPSQPVAVEGLPVDPGYAAAVAVAGDGVPVRCWTLD